ncbi:MAG: DUF4445 domain-containing protein [Firmicutes bacterium]|nr:DUF4445 domain-containing protein [Bacillota bacterium]
MTGKEMNPGAPSLIVATDLGTTNIVARLIKRDPSGDTALLAEITEENCLAEYGPDVLSRVQYCAGDLSALQRLSRELRSQLGLIAEELREEADTELKISEIYAAGNPIMEHFLAGLPADSIAAYPFRPLNFFTDRSWERMSELRDAGRISGAELTIMPCVSGYIGGDTAAGLAALEKELEPSLNYIFMDIGTNGEMVLRMDGRYSCCSAPCGPAFEGAEVSVGRKNGRGYYGSELIDILAALLDAGIIDETGRFTDEDTGAVELDDGYMLTQEDIRNLQLAKAAVAGGLDTMLKLRGADLGRIDRLFIAGVFGANLDPNSAAKTGLIPTALKDKLVSIGNSSLEGVTLAAEQPRTIGRMIRLREQLEYIELSIEPTFTDNFYSHMTLEDDYGA